MRLKLAVVWAVVASACLLGAATGLAAQSGLDGSYGENGVVAVAPHLAGYERQGVLGIDASWDGSAYALVGGLIGCKASSGCEADLYLNRYLSDGIPDITFDGPAGGVPVKKGFSGELAIGVDNEGRPLVALAEGGGFVVRRWTTSGSLDTSFGSGGEVTIPCGCSEMSPHFEFAADGEIVLIGARKGSEGGAARSSVMISRLLPDGRFDGSFGRGGRIQLALGSQEPPRRFALGRGGFVYLAGVGCCGASSNYLLRVSQGGKLDKRFDATTARSLARLRKVSGGYQQPGRALILRPHGKIDLLGRGRGDTGFALRLRADGRVDRGFAHHGLRTFGLPVTEATLGGGGSVFAVGETESGEGALAFRLLPSDRVDQSFGAGKGVRVPGSVGDIGLGVTALSGGRALVLDIGVHECRQVCPPTPKFARFR